MRRSVNGGHGMRALPTTESWSNDRRRGWRTRSRFSRFGVSFGILTALTIAPQPSFGSVQVNYTVGMTGQTASADFSFLDDETLVIVLTETTPAATSPLLGDAATLVRLGFQLTDAIAIPSSATIGRTSMTSGFDAVLSAGADVSAEWGYSYGPIADVAIAEGRALQVQATEATRRAQDLDTQAAAEATRAASLHDAANALLASDPSNPDIQEEAAELHRQAEQDERDARDFSLQAVAERELATELTAQAVARLTAADAALDYFFLGVQDQDTFPIATIPPASNLVGPDNLGGPDGGLLADLAATDSLGVVSNSLVFSLRLLGGLSPAQQEAFLDRALLTSFVQYGTGATSGAGGPGPGAGDVPAPSSALVFALGGVTLLQLRQRRLAKSRRRINGLASL